METKHITISKEYLDRIRRFAAIKPDETFIYVPEAYRDLPEELKVRFTLRPITGEQALRFSDAMRGEVMVENGKALVTTKRGEFTINVVRQGLVSWENYYDSNGIVVPYAKGILENFPRALLEELCDTIMSRASLTEEEVLGLK